MAEVSAGQQRVLWAAATLMEREYGDRGNQVISAIMDDLMEKDDIKGVELWIGVAERYEALCDQANNRTN